MLLRPDDHSVVQRTQKKNIPNQRGQGLLYYILGGRPQLTQSDPVPANCHGDLVKWKGSRKSIKPSSAFSFNLSVVS